MDTARIQLRPWREEDAAALYRHASDPEVGPRAGWLPHRSIDESREIIRTLFANDHTWAIVLRTSDEPIGCIGYYTPDESNIDIGSHDAEVGYWVARPYWNQGIATEALQLLINYCFNEKGFRTIWADHFPDNPASGRVMQKCGFRDTGQLNLCSRLALGADRPVKVMRLDNPTTKHMEYITEKNRIHLLVDGEDVAEVTFPETAPGIYTIDHTYVSPTLRGQGIANELVRRAVEEIKGRGATVRATCSYAIAWLQLHAEKR